MFKDDPPDFCEFPWGCVEDVAQKQFIQLLI